MKGSLTFRQWLMLALTIYAIEVGVFIASELFKNTEYLIYPSVFILILTCLIGPGVIAGTFPPETAEKHPNAALIVRICAYPFCLLSLRLIYIVLHSLGLL